MNHGNQISSNGECIEGNLHGKDHEANTDEVFGSSFIKDAEMFFAVLFCVLTPDESPG